MIGPPFRSPGFIFTCLAGFLTLFATLACTGNDKEGGGLYVFDNATSTVQVWKDVEELHSAARNGAPAPGAVRSFKSGTFNGITLAWGGMALDGRNNRLYLVSEEGKVYAIANPRTLEGTFKAKDKITVITLGSSSDRFGGGSVFGPASVDPVDNVLYVMESGRRDHEARVWRVPTASKLTRQTLGRQNTFAVANDTHGVGVAAGVGKRVYALFGAGDSFEDAQGDDVLGPRLREGANGIFPTNPGHQRPINTLVGNLTQLPAAPEYGSVAYDGRRHSVYVLAPPVGDAPASILAFGEGQFHGRHNQAPERTLPEPPRDLRIIVHPVLSDWLLGAGFTRTGPQGQGTGQRCLYLWKAPGDGGNFVKVAELPGVREVRGMALDAD